MRATKLVAAGLAALSLGACTYGSDLERGAIGAAVGAVTADAIDESPTVGAAVGAAVGVLADG